MKNTNRLWLLMGKKLSGSITMAEEAEFELLLEQDPEIWYSYELLLAVMSMDEVPAEFLNEINSLLDGQPNPKGLVSRLSAQVNTEPEVTGPSKRSKRNYFFAVSIAVLFLLFGSVAYIQWKRSDAPVLAKEMNEIVAPKGSKTQIILADGTEIWLNAGSKLVYPKNLSMENREVYLDGEAYFKVVHSDEYSFIVHTPEADIKDLGTTFNVKAYHGSRTTETTLIEGSIEVVLKKNPSQKILVEPNEKFILHNQDHPQNSAGEGKQSPIFEVAKVVPYAVTNDIIETAWVNDKLIFRNQRFEDLAKEIERRYNVNIQIREDYIKDYQLTGIFEKESIEEAISYLQYIAKFNYTIDNEQIFITE